MENWIIKYFVYHYLGFKFRYDPVSPERIMHSDVKPDEEYYCANFPFNFSQLDRIMENFFVIRRGFTIRQLEWPDSRQAIDFKAEYQVQNGQEQINIKFFCWDNGCRICYQEETVFRSDAEFLSQLGLSLE